MRHIFKVPEQDSHLSHPTNQLWQGPPPHSATATSLTDAAPLGTIPWDPQHPQRTGIIQGIYPYFLSIAPNTLPFVISFLL